MDGENVVRTEDPALPAPVPEDCAATAPQAAGIQAAAAGRTVSGTLDRFVRAGALSTEDRDRYAADYRHAVTVRGRLRGRPQLELAAVVRQFEAFVKRGVLTSSRVRPLFMQLERNTQYWQTGRIPVAPQPKQAPCSGKAGLGGARVEFDGDPVVYQWYPGQGLQIQENGTFGRANALANACRPDAPRSNLACDQEKLRAAADGIVSLAVDRGGFKAWEYYFAFGGGRPPWISSLATGTAMQALTRATEVLGDEQYRDLAGEAVGAFTHRYPLGVRAPGPHFLLYSFDPGLRVFNANFQALSGLFDYAQASGDAHAKDVFDGALPEARREARQADTGAWSLYSRRGAESDLGYHKLVRDFLNGLCERTKAAAFCATAKRFTADLREGTRVRVLGVRRGGVRVLLSKVSCVTLRVNGRPAVVRVMQRGAGTLAARVPGAATVTVDAEDLAGHHTVVTRRAKG